jgi:hypothetical protein
MLGGELEYIRHGCCLLLITGAAWVTAMDV